MSKILFLCQAGEDQFIPNIVEHMAGKHDVKVCLVREWGQDVIDQIHWADMIWQEWADPVAVQLTNYPGLLDSKKIIVRLHSSEAVNGYMENVNWNRVHAVVYVAKHIEMISKLKMIQKGIEPPKGYLIPNMIDMDKWKLVERKKSDARKIVWVPTLIRPLKGPMLMVQAMAQLVSNNPSWTLHVAGKFADQRDFIYLHHICHLLEIQDNITYYGYRNSMQDFYDDKSIVVSFSSWEGNPVNIIEAAATGCIPLIHNFMGSEDQYPKAWIWKSVDEFVDKVKEAMTYNLDRSPIRLWAEHNHSFKKNIVEIEKVIEETMKV
jgi:glycosyltransferase involved in cell wall biosynthesis